uniref:Choline transporter-like protein n=1 Tax=Heligmosomoides polygyrus TaxID=6339 RepID=A0A8L8Q886_HELPZ
LDNGDPYRIVFGSDSFGNTCGRNNSPIWIRSNKSGPREQFEFSGQDMTERRFMLPLNVSQAFDTIWACVHKCPEKTITSYEEVRSEAVEHRNSLCVDHESAVSVTEQKHRVDILNRCIPEDLMSFGKKLFEKVLEMDLIRGFLHDLIDASPYLLQMCLLALVLAVLTVGLLRFFAAVIVYFVYLAVVLLAVGFSGSVWYAFLRAYKSSTEERSANFTSKDLETVTKPAASRTQNLATAVLFKDVDFDKLLNFEDTTTLTLLALGIGATVISVFVVAVVWCVIPRGKKMVRLFKGASLALSAMPSLLLQPLFSAVMILMMAVYSLSVVLVLFTAGDMVSRRISNGNGKDDSILVIETNMTRTTKLMMFYQFVGFVWVTEFFMACQRLFIAGAVSMYYFDVLSMSRRFASPTPRSPLRCSLWNLLRYHLGSAALGAFIITLVRVPRYLVIWTLARMRSVENVILKKILYVFVWILGCIENCLQYINYNVFTVISYSGFSFCPAAKMLWPTLSHPWFPLLIMFICSYQIANCFLSVYEMAIDTIMLCCAEELVLLRDNPEMAQQFRDYMDGTCEMKERSVRFIRATAVDEGYPLNAIDGEEK